MTIINWLQSWPIFGKKDPSWRMFASVLNMLKYEFIQKSLAHCMSRGLLYTFSFIILLIFRKHFKILFYLRINCAKCPNTEFFLVHIFLYSDWIQRFTVNICIQSEYRKIQTKKNSAFGQFSRSDALTR